MGGGANETVIPMAANDDADIQSTTNAKRNIRMERIGMVIFPGSTSLVCPFMLSRCGLRGLSYKTSDQTPFRSRIADFVSFQTNPRAISAILLGTNLAHVASDSTAENVSTHKELYPTPAAARH